MHSVHRALAVALVVEPIPNTLLHHEISKRLGWGLGNGDLVIAAEALEPGNFDALDKLVEADDALDGVAGARVARVLGAGAPHHHAPAGRVAARAAAASGIVVGRARLRVCKHVRRQTGRDVGLAAGLGRVGKEGQGAVADWAVVVFVQLRGAAPAAGLFFGGLVS